LFDEDVVDHAEARAVVEHLDAHGGVPDRHAVDGSDDDAGGVVGEGGLEAVLDRLGPSLTRRPDDTALHGCQLGDGGPGQLAVAGRASVRAAARSGAGGGGVGAGDAWRRSGVGVARELDGRLPVNPPTIESVCPAWSPAWRTARSACSLP